MSDFTDPNHFQMTEETLPVFEISSSPNVRHLLLSAGGKATWQNLYEAQIF